MQKQVTMYSTPICHFSEAARQFFSQHGVAFMDHNILEDIDRQKEMIDTSGQVGVPVIVVGDEMVIGFDEERLKEILGV